MKKIKKFIGHAVPDKSNKLLLPESKTQLLLVINYYFFQTMFQGLQKNFFLFLNSISIARTQSQAQAKIQSQAQAKAQAQLTTGQTHLPGTAAGIWAK